jgi:hypothetical protein
MALMTGPAVLIVGGRAIPTGFIQMSVTDMLLGITTESLTTVSLMMTTGKDGS